MAALFAAIGTLPYWLYTQRWVIEITGAGFVPMCFLQAFWTWLFVWIAIRWLRASVQSRCSSRLGPAIIIPLVFVGVEVVTRPAEADRTELVTALLQGARAHVARAVFMVQKEMADRIVAPPGNKTYGALSVMLQSFAACRTVVQAPAGAFTPAPKVDSAVVRLDFTAAPALDIPDEEHYRAVVHAAFGQRRKTLRNALRAVYAEAAVDAALAATGIDGVRRGETLTLVADGWVQPRGGAVAPGDIDAGAWLFDDEAFKLVPPEKAKDFATVYKVQSPRGPIRISLPLSFGLKRLGPLLLGFAQRHPEISLDMDYTDRRVNLIEEGVDLSIRITARLDPGDVARRIGSSRLIVVASPDYLARHGMPQHPDELADHECLGYTAGGSSQAWTFVVDGQTRSVAIRSRINAGNGDVLAEAAALGMGIACQPDFIVDSFIASGRVRAILADFPAPDRPVSHSVAP